MAGRKLLIINSAAQMVDFCPLKKFRGKLPLQRSADVVSVFRLFWVGNPYGDDDQPLFPPEGKVSHGFCQPQNAAGIEAAIRAIIR